MGPRVVYKTARAEDAAELFERMRLSDVRELVAVSGDDADIKKVIEEAIEMSHHAIAAYTTKMELFALFGVAVCNREANIASPWLLATDRADEYSKELVRDARKFVADWKNQFSGLINFVDCRNTTSIRWLMRIGFKIHEPIKYGKMGLMFHPFTI